tara:strand:- start:8411 stop:9265 length:855 start_codon:yes stop_codon:yes gene_type:complete
MIIWLASYPKSGNTWVRSFIVSLLFNKNNEANLKELYNIPQYPLRSHFNNLLDNIDDIKEISSNWINSQKRINSDNKIKFLKTHHALCKIENSTFTNYETSLGAIHIVRDPRNIVTSILYHFSKKNYLDAKEFLLDNNKTLGKKFDESDPNVNQNMFTPIFSWKNHYNTWKNFKKNYLLIKYEDLISNPNGEFYKIYNYISNIMNLELDKDKIELAIKSNSFENLQKLEKSGGYKEAIKDKKSGELKQFFNLGPENKWENILDKEIKEEIEKEFKNEMEELGYL